jgi:hypothetical protein
MEITWESTSVIVEGSKASAYHDVDGKLHIVYLPTGTSQPHIVSAPINLGIWENLVFTDPAPIAPDNNVINLNIFQQPDDNMWIVWETDKQHRIAVVPDTGEIYDPESVYRLYYAVDTEKLYMNISEIWTFIGSPNIQQLVGYQEVLNGAPIYDDTELRQRLEALELAPPTTYDDSAIIARLDALEAGAPPPAEEPPPVTETPSTITRDYTGGNVSLLGPGSDQYATPYLNLLAGPNDFIRSISVWLDQTSASADIKLLVCPDVAGKPDNTSPLYESPFLPISNPDMHKVTATLPTDLPITYGVNYWIVASVRGSTLGSTFYQGKTTAAEVGTMYYSPGANSWTSHNEKLAYELGIVNKS